MTLCWNWPIKSVTICDHFYPHWHVNSSMESNSILEFFSYDRVQQNLLLVLIEILIEILNSNNLEFSISVLSLWEHFMFLGGIDCLLISSFGYQNNEMLCSFFCLNFKWRIYVLWKIRLPLEMQDLDHRITNCWHCPKYECDSRGNFHLFVWLALQVAAVTHEQR